MPAHVHISKHLLILALSWGISTGYGQNKKEQILILSSRIDSLKEILSNERSAAESASRQLNTIINKGKRKADSLLNALTRTSADLQQRESRLSELNRQISELKSAQVRHLQSIRQKADSLTEFSALYNNIKLQSDSLTRSLSHLKESINNPQAPVSVDDLRMLTKANLEKYSTEDLIASMDAIPENRFYENTRSTEFGVYEKLIGNKVFVRGFISSGCGDCYGFVLNYYTSDGFLFHQEQEEACIIEPAATYTKVKMDIDPKTGYKSFDVYNGFGEQLNLESIKNSAAALKNFRNVPTGYRLTGKTKPQVFECYSPRGIE